MTFQCVLKYSKRVLKTNDRADTVKSVNHQGQIIHILNLFDQIYIKENLLFLQFVVFAIKCDLFRAIFLFLPSKPRHGPNVVRIGSIRTFIRAFFYIFLENTFLLAL